MKVSQVQSDALPLYVGTDDTNVIAIIEMAEAAKQSIQDLLRSVLQRMEQLESSQQPAANHPGLEDTPLRSLLFVESMGRKDTMLKAVQ